MLNADFWYFVSNIERELVSILKGSRRLIIQWVATQSGVRRETASL